MLGRELVVKEDVDEGEADALDAGCRRFGGVSQN